LGAAQQRRYNNARAFNLFAESKPTEKNIIWQLVAHLIV